MPLGGGTIESVIVSTGPQSRQIPVEVRGNQIWPKRLIPAHQLLAIDVVIKRPGWIAWLAGNQNKSEGFWQSYSLNKNIEHHMTPSTALFMNDAATAYAVLALTEANRH